MNTVILQVVVGLLACFVGVLGSQQPFSKEGIRELLQARCGQTGSAVWKYEGSLYDPMDGRRICGVEGLEVVRYLGGSAENGKRTSLKSKDLPGHTILSRKLFCYRSSDSHNLLTSFRLRPNSPRREIPLTQAVALYETATTFFGKRNGRELVCHTEFPDGKCLWTTSDAGSSYLEAGSTTFDFTVYTKKQSADVPNVSDDPDDESQDSSVVVAPKRSRLVQFGPGPKTTDGRFGARETYSYTLSEQPKSKRWKFWLSDPPLVPRCDVKYTRYGEGPPWYGPGRYCTLELKGRRIDDLGDVPPMLASFVAQKLPGFLSANAEITSDEEANDAVRWFKSQSMRLQESESDDTTEDSWKQRAKTYWNRLREASSHRGGMSNSDSRSL